MEEDNQGNDDMIEFKYGIHIEPCDGNSNAEDIKPAEDASGNLDLERTQREENPKVSLRSHRRQIKAKDFIIQELQTQVNQLENTNKRLNFEKRKLANEVSRLKKEAKVQIVREVVRNQSPVNKNLQSVGGAALNAKPMESGTVIVSGTINSLNQQNIGTAKTVKLSEPKHSVWVARPHLKHFQCSCGKLCKSWSSIRYHTNAKNNKSVFLCDFCSKRYTSPANLKIHLKKTHNVNHADQFACWTCGIMLNSRKMIREHRSIVHPKTRRQ